MQITVNNLTHLQKIIDIIAPALDDQDVILLDGDLGAGKTTIAQSLIKALSNDAIEVSSPTFGLQHIYHIQPKFQVQNIAHMDLYRLKSADELAELGIEDYFGTHLCLIEWPSKLEQHMPESYLYIGIKISDDHSRELVFKCSEDQATKLSAMGKKFTNLIEMAY